MSRLDDLPPDQKAALSLLLRRRDSYADLAAVLDISERAVHDRAHAALAMLAPEQARSLTSEQREEIGEFLLGQQRAADAHAATLRLLETSADARAWAQELTSELAPIGNGALPHIPGSGSVPAPAATSPQPPSASTDAPLGAAAGAPLAGVATDAHSAPAAARPALPVSRTAGAILLALLIAGAVLAAVLIGSGGSSKSSAASGKTPASRGGATSSGSGKPAVDKRITLRATSAGSHAVGVALVLSEGGKYAFYLAAERMPPSNGFFYAAWLYNSPTSAEPLGKSAPVSSNGRLQGGALLPSDAGKFSHLIVTRETNEHPRKPGPIVLSGEFALH